MKFTALLVDDEQENIELLSIYLKKHFPNVEICASAANVEEGIEKYYEHLPDILFLDIELGDENSFAIIESLSNLTSGQVPWASDGSETSPRRGSRRSRPVQLSFLRLHRFRPYETPATFRRVPRGNHRIYESLSWVLHLRGVIGRTRRRATGV